MGALTRAAGYLEGVGRAIVAPLRKNALTGGMRWIWPTGTGDMGPPGAWQRNLNPNMMDPSTLAAFSAVYACVNRIAGDMAKLPIRIVEIRDNDEQIDLLDDPFATLMREPNAYQSRIDFVQTLMSSTLLQGNGYALIHRNGRNEPDELHPWDSRTVTPQIGADGSLFYKMGPNQLAGHRNGLIAPARDVIHHRLPMSAGYPLHGITPIYAAAPAAATGLRILQQSQQFFGNMARPSGVLSTEQNITEDDAKKMKIAWRENYREGGIGDTAVLGFGVKWEAITLNAVDSQLIETLRYSVEDVCRAFSVPPFLVGDTSKVTYRNSEQLARMYLQQTLGYHVEALQERLRLSFDFGRRFKLIFDLDDLLKTEMDARFGAYQKGLAAGWLGINEVRALEGYAPRKGGDEPMVQMQNIPLSIAVENAKNPPAPPAALPPPPTDDTSKALDLNDDGDIDDDEASDVEARVAALLGVAS